MVRVALKSLRHHGTFKELEKLNIVNTPKYYLSAYIIYTQKDYI